MNLSQDQLKAFYQVTKVGSFTKAAQDLGLTQPALSHRIKNLEDQLETTLFVREPTGIRLTEAGSKLLRYCRVLSQMEAEFEEDFHSSKAAELHGFLRLGGASTLMWSVVTPALGSLLREHPEIQIEMISREISELPKLLETGNIDFAVTCGRLDLPNCEEIHLGVEKSILVESRKATARASVYLDHDQNDRTTFEYLKVQKSQESKYKRAYMDTIEGILAGVKEGLGQAVIPIHLYNSKDFKKVKNQKELQTPIYLYYPKQPYYTRLHQQTVRSLVEQVPLILASLEKQSR